MAELFSYTICTSPYCFFLHSTSISALCNYCSCLFVRWKELLCLMGSMNFFSPHVRSAVTLLNAIWVLFARFNDFMIILASVLGQCRHLIRPPDSCSFGLDRSWCGLRRAVVQWQFWSILRMFACVHHRLSFDQDWIWDMLVQFTVHNCHCSLGSKDAGCRHKIFFWHVRSGPWLLVLCQMQSPVLV